MAEGDILTSGKGPNNEEAGIIHLELMKYDRDYPILIEGKRYNIRLSNSDHLWLIKTNEN